MIGHCRIGGWSLLEPAAGRSHKESGGAELAATVWGVNDSMPLSGHDDVDEVKGMSGAYGIVKACQDDSSITRTAAIFLLLR